MSKINSYPTSTAQDVILKALNMTAKDFQDAEKRFEELGIIVTSKRSGRSSVPVVTAREGKAQRNYGGDYDVAEVNLSNDIREKLAQWWID